MKQVFIFMIDESVYHVNINAMYADRTIPHTIFEQVDNPYIEGKITPRDYRDLTKMLIAVNRYKSKEIYYQDFMRAIQYHLHDFRKYIKSL